jgi:UDP-N-acetylglucosamine transferase subunit ALG13
VTALLVCSVGGHLAELHALAPRIHEAGGERLWVTFDTEQSRSLLRGEDVLFLGYTGPRDLRNITRHSLRARKLLRGAHGVEHVISTGSGVALSFLPWARMRGACCHYIESFTRIDGPSATGRALAAVPGVHLYTQHSSLAHGRWRQGGSIFDQFSQGPSMVDSPDTSTGGGARPLQRAVVTVGTMRDYPFARMLKRLHELLPAEAEVLWQSGCAPVGQLPIDGVKEVAQADLEAAIVRADVVVAHAGCGSAMTALRAGKLPLLVPRRAAYGENVDDHQVQLGAELARRGLAVVREVDELDHEALALASAGVVLKARRAPRFVLDR